MDGQVSFNQPLSGLLYKITDVNWAAADNKLTVLVSLFLTGEDTAPLVQRVYYIPLGENPIFTGLQAAINGVIKTEIEKDGQFTVQPFETT